MASYYERPLRSDELYHAWLKKGAKADDHKYIARIPQGKGYRYFYSKSEYQSYLQGDKPTRQKFMKRFLNEVRFPL